MNQQGKAGEAKSQPLSKAKAARLRREQSEAMEAVCGLQDQRDALTALIRPQLARIREIGRELRGAQ